MSRELLQMVYDAMSYGNAQDRESARLAVGAALAEQPAQRKPLTDDELADLWYKQSLDWMEFARAIEAAHNIKENT